MIRFLLLSLALTPAIAAQDSRDAAHHFRGEFNWNFRSVHTEAARLFNAFDYGHAVLYERLLTLDRDEATLALVAEYKFLVDDLLVRPPRFGVAEEAIAPQYSKLAWPAIRVFDAAHVLHRQIYDIYSSDRMPATEKRRLTELVIDWYLADRKHAIVPVAKSMMLMEGQPFSKRFRLEQPHFNGLIWAYHWLQVGLYEPLMTAGDGAGRRQGVDSMVAEFRGMLTAPGGLPDVMPMTAEVSPVFARTHPRAAAIFDNLHMMHDIISDILASPEMNPAEKRAEILRQLSEMRDPVSNLMEMHDH